ncbi:MAG: cation transporter [Candidatus Omnitrophica bacterium]|nr:cation transporter [Candidatus Omnitrophota bacterium]
MKNQSSIDRFKRSLRSVLIGLVCNIILACTKIIAGILGNSYALIADGVESTTDIFSSAIVLGGLKIGSMPADEHHPYGHGRAESLAAMIASVALLVVGVGIATESIREIGHPHHAPAAFTLVVLVVVVFIKEFLSRFIFSIGKDVNSFALEVDAWHHRLDAMTSFAAFIGISIALLGGKGYECSDDWAALAASVIIFFNGCILLKKAVAEIMDRAPSSQTEAIVRKTASEVPGVVAIEKCRLRKSGLQLFVDIHVEVDGKLCVMEAHDISHHVKDTLIAAPLGIVDVLVHIEPAPHNY